MPGTYGYALSGTTQTPLVGTQRPYPAGSVLSVAMSVTPPGTVTARATSTQDNATTSTTWLYGSSGVALTASHLTFAGLASYDCTYTPPPVVLPNPLKAGALPSTSFSNGSCSGSVTVNVLDAEAVTAAGQSWQVWRVQTSLHYTAQSSVDVTVNSTGLFSPALGTVITSDSTTTGSVTGQPFSNHQVTTLTSHP